MAAVAAIPAVTDDALEFVDTARGRYINVLPLERAQFMPRPGDLVDLPGRGEGAHRYRVTAVRHVLIGDPNDDPPFGFARLQKIVVEVEPI